MSNPDIPDQPDCVSVADANTSGSSVETVPLWEDATGRGGSSLTYLSPSPDSRSPLELVVSERTAIAALVRHYGWIHLNNGTLVRHGLGAVA